MSIVDDAKKYCLDIIGSSDDVFSLESHLPEAEKWAKKILENYPDADEEIVLLTVWLHDVSHYVGDRDTDHAVRSEKMAREFLEKNNYDPDKLSRVLHAVRSHRNRDVAPETIEAKIFACADSASHMTDTCYVLMCQTGRFEYLAGKLKRDYRDISMFPEIQKMLTPLYENWQDFAKIYEELGLSEPIAPSKSKLGFN